MLTNRDQEILKIIHFYRYVTVQDITYRLFKPSVTTYVRKLLSVLCGGKDQQDNQYLYRFAMPKITKGNPERIFTLGNKGREFLVNFADVPLNRSFRYSRPASLNYTYLTHSLAVTHVLVTAYWWGKQQDIYQLIDTKISYQFTGNSGKNEDNMVIPDGWLLFAMKDGRRGAVLVEIDRGTEYQQKFKEHVAARLRFMESRTDEKVLGIRTMRIVYISVGDLPYRETRRRTMAHWTKEVLQELGKEEWGTVFRFAAVGLDEVYEVNLFEENIWYSLDSDKGIRLFGS